MGRKTKRSRVAHDVRAAALEQCDNIADAIKLIKSSINELVSAEEAAIMCGMSKSAFIRLSNSGKAPAGIKLERLRRWRKREILAWIAAGCPVMTTGGQKAHLNHNTRQTGEE